MNDPLSDAIAHQLRVADIQCSALNELISIVLRLPLRDEDMRMIAAWARRHTEAIAASRARIVQRERATLN